MTSKFSVSREGIASAIASLFAAADAGRLNHETARRLSIVVDEYCSNLIRHDSSLSPDSQFEMVLDVRGGGPVLTLCDEGHPFDPTRAGDMPFDDIGGHGIRIIRGLASELEYTTSGRGNCLRVTVSDER